MGRCRDEKENAISPQMNRDEWSARYLIDHSRVCTLEEGLTAGYFQSHTPYLEVTE